MVGLQQKEIKEEERNIWRKMGDGGRGWEREEAKKKKNQSDAGRKTSEAIR